MKAKPKAAGNFEEFERVITGRGRPARVHLVELGVDQEVERYVTEEIFGDEWVDDTEETRGEFARRHVDFYAGMGYDFAPVGGWYENMPQFKERWATDTAGLSRGRRQWVEEGGGIIRNREDLERIDWEGIRGDFGRLEEMRKVLPEGMKLAAIGSVFEVVLERFLGYQDLFVLSVDDPELVEAVFERWGQIVYDYYGQVLEYPEVGAIFHADDLGFKTATLMSPEFLRKNVFPWLAKYAALAHERGRTFWYHCCGNVAGVMGDLIEDVGIDAFHSFQDVIIPVGDFLDRYGSDVAALGGVDVDNLARMDEPDLRAYVRKILDECMPGRFALGSGNTVANYIPVRNYLAMVDEARCWSG